MKMLLAGILTSGLLVLGCAPATSPTKSGPPPGPRSGGAQGMPSQGAKAPGRPADADKAKTTDEPAHPDKDKDNKDK